MNTLKIEIPLGYEIDSFDKQSGEIKFKAKPKKVTERILTVDDVLADNGLTRAAFDESCKGLTQDEIAYRVVKMLAKSLNEGWTPDWSNDSQYKYYPWFGMRGSAGFQLHDYGSWASNSNVGSRLCFKSRELAEHAGKHFTEVYEKFMLIK